MSLTTTNQADSPSRGANAKVHVYEEKTTDFGVFGGGGAREKKTTIAKISFDHLGVDVPTDEMLREQFDFFDKDGSGAIDLNEFREVFKNSFDNFGAPMEDRDIDRMFAKLDRGTGKGVKGDGKLHFDEFAVLVLSRYSM